MEVRRQARWRWGVAHNQACAIQWSTEYALSLGVHIEPRTRRNNQGDRYGPYVDVHVPFAIVSVGRRPVYSKDWDSYIGGRGGEIVDRHESRERPYR